MTTTIDCKLRKKLVYHFWCPTYELTNYQKFIMNLHLNLLKHYSSIFDDVQINIACDDIHYPLVNTLRHKLTDIFSNENQNLFIKSVINTQLREGKTCYEEVFAPGSEYDGIVFFGHSKGLTNALNEPNINNIKHWVVGLYWLSLNFMDECEHYMNNTECFYGSILNKCNETTMWFYSGSFYWSNIHNIKYRLSFESNQTIKQLSALSRAYAEMIPQILFPEFNISYTKCHNATYTLIPKNFDTYGNALSNIETSCFNHPDTYKEFLEFSANMFDCVEKNNFGVNIF